MWGSAAGFCYPGPGGAQQVPSEHQVGADNPFVLLLLPLETTTVSSPADIPVVAMVVLGLAGEPCCS